jgi:predicted ABC-type ATPase
MLIDVHHKGFYLYLNVNSKILYVVAGCNGAGKTTASFNILPQILECREYVNADEIARGISPFNQEGVSIEAGRIMLSRINELIDMEVNFAFETTLASKNFKNTIQLAKDKGYLVTLIFFWLRNENLAIKRVQNRVAEGGHFIPEDVIKRRYLSGIKNLFNLYWELPDIILVYDNTDILPEVIVSKEYAKKEIIHNLVKYEKLRKYCDG